MIAVNKWDAVHKTSSAQRNFRSAFYGEFKYLAYVPVIFVSAKTNFHLERLVGLVKRVYHNHNLRIKSSVLNNVITDAIAMTPTPLVKGRRLRIYYATQVAAAPPTFVFFVNDPHLMHFSYARYLQNQIRAHFGFIGTPLKFISRRRS